MQVLRRFATLRGWPKKIFSDNGSNLVAASKELRKIVIDFNWNELKEYCLGPERSTAWEFSPPDGPWYNGAAESMVKSVKRALNAAIGVNILKFSELQTCLFEAAEIVNERPIGIHPASPSDGVYLSPNDLLLGRSSPKIPQGEFMNRASDKHRFDFLQKIVQQFWNRWMQEVFPDLVIQPKWHTASRDLCENDVVLIKDASTVRGKWQMG